MAENVAVNLAAWLACAAFMVMLLHNGTRLWRSWSGQGQTMDVRKLDTYITRDFHTTCHTALEGRVTRVEAEVIAVRQEMRQDREVSTQRILTEVKGVHDRVNGLQEAVGRIEGKLGGTHHGT